MLSLPLQNKVFGFIVNIDGIKTDPEKIEKVKLFPRFHIKTLRSFLGSAFHCRKFNADFQNCPAAHPKVE